MARLQRRTAVTDWVQGLVGMAVSMYMELAWLCACTWSLHGCAHVHGACMAVRMYMELAWPKVLARQYCGFGWEPLFGVLSKGSSMRHLCRSPLVRCVALALEC
jgi:hypothetical protein